VEKVQPAPQPLLSARGGRPGTRWVPPTTGGKEDSWPDTQPVPGPPNLLLA